MSSSLLDEPIQTQADEEAGSNRRAMDEELKIIGSIIRTLGDLDDAARVRVMAYLSSRYASEKE